MYTVRCLCIGCIWFFFCKQKTAYEVRISDWSSDVCSSDLAWLNQVGGLLIAGWHTLVFQRSPLGKCGFSHRWPRASAPFGKEQLEKKLCGQRYRRTAKLCL